MKRLVQLSLFVFFASFSLVYSGESGNNKRATSSINNSRSDLNYAPEWLYNRPIVGGGNFDREPIFARRRGTVNVDFLEEYAGLHSEEHAKTLKDRGVTLYIIHLFKGFGLAVEREYIENSIRFARFLRKHGIKVGVYIGDTIAYETFLSEVPEAGEWLVPDYLGAPVTYGSQLFRRRPYIGHPDYVAYLKKVVDVAINEVKADFIHFDNSCSQALPENFHHPLAIEQFRTFLTDKYSLEQLKDRFGFSNMSHVLPPKIARKVVPQPITDPLFQEWTDFRCQKLSDHYLEMRKYIKSLNPEVVVEHNPHGVTGHNKAWLRGVDWPRTLASTEIFWSEGERDPGYRDDILVNKIRSYKVGQTLDNLCLTVTGSGNYRLRMAESMAYNQNCMGFVGFHNKIKEQYIHFFSENFAHYRDSKSVADVAILRTFPTMAYSNYNIQYSTILFEQTLIQEKIPFDIIFENNLLDLSKYSVLVLANQEYISDENIKIIKSFAANGGGLVITENTSSLTEWGRARSTNAFNDIFNEIIQNNELKTSYGKGKVAYIPKITPSINRPATKEPTSEYWKLPLNQAQLVDAVNWVSDREMSYSIDAPAYVTAEVSRNTDSSKLMLHLLNYNVERNSTTSVANIGASVKIPNGKSVKSILLTTPDKKEPPKPIEYKSEGGNVSFTVPHLEVYNLVVISL